VTTAVTAHVQPAVYSALISRPWTWMLALGIGASPILVLLSLRKGRALPAFLASVGFIVCLLAATAAGLYPVMLSSTLDHANDLTATNAATGAVGLRIGLIWWTMALLLAIGYFTCLYRSFRGKVAIASDGHGY